MGNDNVLAMRHKYYDRDANRASYTWVAKRDGSIFAAERKVDGSEMKLKELIVKAGNQAFIFSALPGRRGLKEDCNIVIEPGDTIIWLHRVLWHNANLGLNSSTFEVTMIGRRTKAGLEEVCNLYSDGAYLMFHSLKDAMTSANRTMALLMKPMA